MRKDNKSSLITPGKLKFLENPLTILAQPKINLIPMKDVILSPKKNTRLTLTLKSSRVNKFLSQNSKYTEENLKLPSFLFDFLDEERPQIHKSSRKHINIFDNSYTPKRHRIKNSLKGSMHKEKLPDISNNTSSILRDFTTSERKSSLDADCWYKPYIIEISPRANLTLYAAQPINLQQSNEGISHKKNRRFRTTSKKRITGNKIKKIEDFMQPVIITSPAKSFAEKLQRVQDIAREAEKSFNYCLACE